MIDDLTVGPVCYCLVSEMSSTRLRAKTLVLARTLYNLVSIVNGVLMPYFLSSKQLNWGAKTALFWGGTSFLSLGSFDSLFVSLMLELTHFISKYGHSTDYQSQLVGRTENWTCCSHSEFQRDSLRRLRPISSMGRKATAYQPHELARVWRKKKRTQSTASTHETGDRASSWAEEFRCGSLWQGCWAQGSVSLCSSQLEVVNTYTDCRISRDGSCTN